MMSRPLAIIIACVAIVLYVRSPMAEMGELGLLGDLLFAVAVVWWLRRQLRLPPAPRTTARQRARGAGFADAGTGARGDGRREDGASAAAAPWDPYAVLGIARDATADEISRAYRTQMKLYHPDRVADLGSELQEVAHRRSIDIQRAYEELGPG